jgi:hypothetical protein
MISTIIHSEIPSSFFFAMVDPPVTMAPAPSDSRGVNRYDHGPSVCKFPINVTVPSRRRQMLGLAAL